MRSYIAPEEQEAFSGQTKPNQTKASSEIFWARACRNQMARPRSQRWRRKQRGRLSRDRHQEQACYLLHAVAAVRQACPQCKCAPLGHPLGHALTNIHSCSMILAFNVFKKIKDSFVDDSCESCRINLKRKYFHRKTTLWKSTACFLGPRGPLWVPLVPFRPSAKSQTNHYKSLQFRSTSNLSNHIFSESSWPLLSTDAPRRQIHKQIHTYTNTKIVLERPIMYYIFEKHMHSRVTYWTWTWWTLAWKWIISQTFLEFWSTYNSCSMRYSTRLLRLWDMRMMGWGGEPLSTEGHPSVQWWWWWWWWWW